MSELYCLTRIKEQASLLRGQGAEKRNSKVVKDEVKRRLLLCVLRVDNFSQNGNANGIILPTTNPLA